MPARAYQLHTVITLVTTRLALLIITPYNGLPGQSCRDKLVFFDFYFFHNSYHLNCIIC